MAEMKSAILSQNYYALKAGKLNNTEETKSKMKSAILGHAGDKPASISGLTYVGGKLLAGIGGTFEGAADFIGGLFGSDEYEEYLYIYDTPIQDFHETLDNAYDPGKVGRFVGDVASGLGQSATFLIPYAGQALFFTGAAGNSISSAAQKTGKVGAKEYAYGIGSAAMEWALERYIGGTGATLESITKKGAQNLGTKLTKHIGKTAAKKTAGKMIASQLISSAVGEGVEEFFGTVGDAFLLDWTGVDNSATVNWGDAVYSFFVGMTSGALMGGVNTGLQNAYEAKSGSEINQNDKRREIMLTEARELVTKGKNLSEGSDAVATHLSTIEAMLKAYDGASDKKSNTANLALGKINSALMSAEFNVITDRHAAYVAQNASDELADYATALFKDVTGETVTVEMLRDINNQYTRALATMDWAGNVVRTIVGADAKMTQEMANKIDEEFAAAEKSRKDAEQKAAYEKDRAEKESVAKPSADAASWNGEDATYHMTVDGVPGLISVKKSGNAYQLSYYLSGKRKDLPSTVTAEQAKMLLADATGGTITNTAEGKKTPQENKRSQDKETVTENENAAESEKTAGETGEGEGSEDKPDRKMSLGEEKHPFAQYEQSQKDNWKDSKRIVVCEGRAHFKEFIQHALADQQYGKKMYLGKISTSLAAVIKQSTGYDLEGYNCSISAYEIRKILKDHGKEETEAPRGQRAVTEDDLLNIPSVMQSPDEVKLAERPYNGKPVLEFTKEINGRMTVKAIISDKHLDLFVQTAYSGIKKETLATPTGEQAPINTPEANSGTDSFDNSISQKSEKSNTLEEKNDNSTRKQSLAEETKPGTERSTAAKDLLGEDEGGIIGSVEEVKRASKLVKGFKLLAAPERNAIIRMMRSAGGIEKATLSSLAHLMSIRPGLNVLFTEGVKGEGSHTELSNDARLILLDPTLKHGKKYRADVIFHELYHDMASTGDLRTLTKTVAESTSAEFRRKIADRYTKHANGISISEWLNGKPYTKANYNAYFEEHKKISRVVVEEEIAAACMAKVMGSSRFIKEYGGNVGIVRRIYHGLKKTAKWLANRAVEIDGEVDGGFTIAFRDVLAYKRAYESALLHSQSKLSEKDIEKLEQLMEDRDEADVEKAKRKLSIGDEKIQTITIEKDPTLSERISNSGRSKYSVIREYLIEKFYGETFVLSDGKKAVMDKSDAKELSHLASTSKEAELGNLKEIVEKAVYDQEAHNVKHKKFNAFYYYAIDVMFENETYPLLVNVGVGRTDNKYHIYDITPNKKRRNAGQASPGLSRVAKTDAIRNVSSDNSISQPDENVKRKLSLSDEEYEKLRDEFLADATPIEELAFNALNEYLESQGFTPRAIDEHGSVFAPEEEDDGASRQQRAVITKKTENTKFSVFL